MELIIADIPIIEQAVSSGWRNEKQTGKVLYLFAKRFALQQLQSVFLVSRWAGSSLLESSAMMIMAIPIIRYDILRSVFPRINPEIIGPIISPKE